MGERRRIAAKKQEKPPKVYSALVELEILPSARLGMHSLRLVGPRGVSDTVSLRVVGEPMLVEDTSVHQTVERAQAVRNFSVVILGRLGKPGELEGFLLHFTPGQGQEVSFEVVSALNCEPRLALYGAGGSWLNPDRPNRLVFWKSGLRTSCSNKPKEPYAFLKKRVSTSWKFPRSLEKGQPIVLIKYGLLPRTGTCHPNLPCNRLQRDGTSETSGGNSTANGW